MKFLQDITLGQYMPGDSFLHHLDPRTKFISLLLLMIVTFLIKTFIALALLAAFFLLTLLISQLSWGYVFRGVRSFIWLFLFTAAIHLFFTPGPSLPLFPIGFIDITWTGAAKGALVASQLLLAILLSSLMTLTTTPLQLAHGLEKLIYPLKRFRIPVEDFSLMTMLAIKFIPILLGEANRIIKAQSSRGVDFESGNFLRRAKNMIPILTPLFHSIFKRADDLAVAMFARGYISGAKRTHLHELKMRGKDYWVLIGVVGFVILEMKIH
ncbi:MAG: energy-coupling factor transporter transmembrane component T [Deltaproteobacteria bacterium]|jgi:energy-coupling factor transport system permease protein|nr:energy-coupling factor transporter transmembrane component T [Deltaproteobacteria bacterium]